MEKRLVSENIIQCPNMTLSSQPATVVPNPASISCCESQFSAYASFVAYRTDQNILKIKVGAKEIRDTEIKLQSGNRFYLAGGNAKVYLVVEATNSLDVYVIEVAGNEMKHQLVEKIANARQSVPLKHGIAYISQQKTIKLLDFQTHSHTPIAPSTPTTQILPHQGTNIFLLSTNPTPILQIYQPSSLSSTLSPQSTLNYQQSPLCIDYIKNPLAIYRDQYIFNDNRQTSQIQIYDVGVSRLVGKVEYQGVLGRVMLRGGVVVVVVCRENMDRYYFYTLSQESQFSSVITHRSVFEKGKSNCYQAYLCNEEQAELIIQGKPSIISKQGRTGEKDDKILTLYVQPLKKAKIQLLKISSTKIKQQAFKQKQLNLIIKSKLQEKQKARPPIQSSTSLSAGKQQSTQNKHQHHHTRGQKEKEKEREDLKIEQIRINSAINHNKNQRIENLQKEIIQKVVEMKMHDILDKFKKLEVRITNLEVQIVKINKKIQKSLETINRDEIQKNVERLFEKVTPQFQSYFNEVFRQISGVLDQGVNYYAMKLAKESEIHREAFNQVVNMTFDAAQEISELGRRELNHSEKTTESLQKLLLIRKKWEHQLLQFADAFKPNRTAVETGNYEINLGTQPLSPDKKSPPQAGSKKN